MSPSAPVSDLAAFGIATAGVFGLLVGSFVNVVIHRLPRGESLASPPSHCTSCGGRIGPLDNVPVVSWLLLRGRCRTCGAPIAARYPAVELANGALWALVFRAAPSWGDFASGALLVSACLALLWIDADFQILPDAITLPATAAGFALSFVSAVRTPRQSFLGILAGAGGLLAVALLYKAARKVEGMGLGDVKMLGMIGAFLGPWGVLVTILLASVSGSAVGIVLLARRAADRSMRLPFGVFLAIGAIAAFFFGASLVARYRGLLP